MTTASGSGEAYRSIEQDWNLLYTHYPHMYDRFSERQDGYDAVAQHMQSVAGGLPGKVLLDVGAGTGRYARRFAPEMAAVICTDPNAQMLRFAERRATELGHSNVTFHQAPAQELPLDGNSVDVVLAAHSLNAIGARELKDNTLVGPPLEQRYAEKRKAMAELFRVLRPGGWLFSLASSPDQYGGELCEIILGANQPEWSRGKARFLNWLTEEYGAESVQLRCDWAFESVDEAAAVFGFVYGHTVRDHIVRYDLTVVSNKLVLQYLPNPKGELGP